MDEELDFETAVHSGVADISSAIANMTIDPMHIVVLGKVCVCAKHSDVICHLLSCHLMTCMVMMKGFSVLHRPASL